MSQSTSNLRQISARLNLYIADHEGYFPASAFDVWEQNRPVRLLWYNGLSYYIDGERDLKAATKHAECPSWQTCPVRRFPEPAKYGGQGVSAGYGWNYKHFGYHGLPGTIDTSGWRSRLSEVELPAETIIVGTNREKKGAVGDPDSNLIEAGDPENILIYESNPNSKRFGGVGLYLFVDGHVARLTPEKAP